MAELSRHRTHPHRSQFDQSWLLSSMLAFVSGAAGLTLALHYPLVPVVAVGVFSALCAAFYVWPYAWMLVIPASLPLIGLAPLSGWITFEELDILILAVAAGGYGRRALRPSGYGEAGHSRPSLLDPVAMQWLLVGLFALATLGAMFRGFADAGGFAFGWFQGYHEPMNSARLAKSIFEALLLMPLWRLAISQKPELAENQLAYGLMLGLAAASLATIWERAAFTGLLNFSSDYRTTGLFWEMHVGGAALDGFLALTVPFALREFLVARTPGRWSVAATVLALAGYSCLTTFSRGVYLAIPVGAAVFWGLSMWQKRQAVSTLPVVTDDTQSNVHLFAAVLLVTGFGVGAVSIFQTSGYRGMAALLGAVALMLPLSHVLRRFSPGQWLQGIGWAISMAFVTGMVAWLVPKGAYVAWGAAAVLTMAMLGLLWRRGNSFAFAGPLAFGSFLATLGATALVANHWAESGGLLHAVPVLCVVLALCLWAGLSRNAFWPAALRWQATTAGVMAMVAVVIGVFGGGSYMSERFSTGGQDIGGRQAHWQMGRDMMRSQGDWLFGKGMGRFPANYFLSGNPQEHPGDYRLREEAQNSYLTVTGGLHVNGWGEIFRVTQRVAEPGKTAAVSARVRAEKDVGLHFEICEKHLLYNQGCLIKQANVKGVPGVWQDLRVELQGDGVHRGDWYAPRLLAFSVATGSRGGSVDLDNLTLTSADGRPLLANGDFSQGMAHWFFSSDRHHMPWHIKSMFMNVLFDQGVIGVTIWGLMLASAFWRISVGKARRHPLAPVFAGSLAGFLVVGLFDSLLDVPRLAWVFYFVLLAAMTLRGQARSMPVVPATRTLAGLALTVLVAWIAVQPLEARAANSGVGAQVIRVGPQRTIKTIAESARLVRAGGIIEVDSGDYAGDVAVWERSDVTVRAVGGRVRLLAQGVAAEGKGIWVVRAQGMRVEGFDFEGAAVPSRNGAGIRLEKGSLWVRDCRFMHNEMGLLTNNDPDTVLVVENSEFAYNQRPDGHNHNLYAGQIARLSVTGSYFHHARVGHLLKSRAAVSQIFYNRLTDEAEGTASYELEFPNGGVAYVVGNIIGQSLQTDNQHLIAFGSEGYRWPRNEIYLVNNTLVDPLPKGGVFLKVAPGANAVRAINNLLVGPSTLELAGPGEYRNNFKVESPNLAQENGLDYRLRASSGLMGLATDPGIANGQSLRQIRQFDPPRGTKALEGAAHNPGAVQR